MSPDVQWTLSNLEASRMAWFDAFMLYRNITVVVSVISITLSACVAAGDRLIARQIWRTIIAVSLAIITGINSAFSPAAETAKFANAWRVLNRALLIYYADKSQDNLENAIHAYVIGENIIDPSSERYLSERKADK